MFRIKLLISWFNPDIIIGFALLQLAGCGWAPLYGPAAPQTVTELQGTKVEVIADRSGQILRNYLIDSLNPHGLPHHPLYRLKVNLEENKRLLSFRRDATARRDEITLTASFELLDTKDQKIIFKDKVITIGGYSLGDQADVGSFSSIIAEKSAREQALRTLSDDIVLKLADYLHHKPSHPKHEN